MLINPFEIKKEKVEENKEEIVNINDIIKYISDNYSKYLKTEKREFFIDKIKEYIYLKYMLNSQVDIQAIINKVLDKIFGYGILQKYIDDENITDIRVTKYNLIFIKKKGIWIKVNDKFESKEEFREYIKYCAIKNNKTINFDEPLLITSDKEYMLRIEAGINPVNDLDDSLVIRVHKNNKDINLFNLYKKYKMLDKKTFCLIKEFINKKSNIIISGKGGSGKTTLLKAILKEVSDTVPMVINEETNELFIEGKNVIQREVVLNKPNNQIDLECLLKHSLVMSNDIIVVGELKGEETYVFFDAINTGHTGITTIHSNSVYSVIDRLILLFKRNIKAEKYNEDFIKELLYRNIDYIIYLKDFKIENIAKVGILNKRQYIENIYNRRNINDK